MYILSNTDIILPCISTLSRAGVLLRGPPGAGDGFWKTSKGFCGRREYAGWQSWVDQQERSPGHLPPRPEYAAPNSQQSAYMPIPTTWAVQCGLW